MDDAKFEALVLRDVRSEALAQESAWLRTDEQVERWLATLKELYRRATVRTVTAKEQLAARQEEYLRTGGPRSTYATLQWHSYKRRHQEGVAREHTFCAEIAPRKHEARELVAALHRRQSLDHNRVQEQMRADALLTLRRSDDSLDDHAGAPASAESAVLRRMIERLSMAITPLASLDSLLPTSAHVDTHLAAYKAVRLKVGDIREARSAWLEAQTFLGGELAEQRDA